MATVEVATTGDPLWVLKDVTIHHLRHGGEVATAGDLLRVLKGTACISSVLESESCND
jgi:hypothetical protein